eukprot:gene43865-53637_t
MAVSSTALATPTTVIDEVDEKIITECYNKLNGAILGMEDKIAWLARVASSSHSTNPLMQQASFVAKGCLMYLYHTGLGGVLKDSDMAKKFGTEALPALKSMFKEEKTKDKNTQTDKTLTLVSWLIGQCYIYGLGCETDPGLGLRYVDYASDISTNRFALASLGACCYNGIGC